jgi:hypothetical protein
MRLCVVLDVARAYASQWGVDVSEPIVVAPKRPWWLIFRVSGYKVAYHTAEGCAVVEIHGRDYRVSRFEFYPAECSKAIMVPLWAAFPGYDSVTINWRTGYGGAYSAAWFKWYERLSVEEKVGYQERFPPPSKGSWSDFYEFVEAGKGRSE